jgi:uncharacterized membrane protein (UPF0127 family)
MRANLTPSPSPVGEGRHHRWRLLIILSLMVVILLISIIFLFRSRHQTNINSIKQLNLNSSLSERAQTTSSVRLNGQVIIEKLYIIDGNSERGSLGLSGISDLKNSGMLFYYQSPKSVNFWMKDMKMNLDIIWLDCSGKILGWQADATPSDYPKTYASPKLNYVLEVEEGFISQYQLKIGDGLELNLSDDFRC